MSWSEEAQIRRLKTYLARRNFNEDWMTPEAIFELIEAERGLGIETYNGPVNMELMERVLTERLYVSEVELKMRAHDKGYAKKNYKNPVLKTGKGTQRFYTYSISPIDFWFGSVSPNDILRAAKNSRGREPGVGENDYPFRDDIHLNRRLTAAFDPAAEGLGLTPEWIMDAPRFGAAPIMGEYSLSHWAARKLSNDGTTIIVSEAPLNIVEVHEAQILDATYSYFYWEDGQK